MTGWFILIPPGAVPGCLVRGGEMPRCRTSIEKVTGGGGGGGGIPTQFCSLTQIIVKITIWDRGIIVHE